MGDIIDSNKVMLPYIQIILAVLLSGLILIQQSDSSLGSAFGGSGDGGSRRTRRGPELWLFRITIGLSIIFVITTLINLLY